MTDNWRIVVGCLFIMFMFAICYLLSLRNVEKVNECVVVQPREVVSVRIIHFDRFYGESSGTMYCVEYRGTTKVTGDPCTIDVLVTKSEHERVIYGWKN